MAEKKRERKPQEYYEQIKERFAEERDLRLGYRPQGTQQFTSDFSGELEKYAVDPFTDVSISQTLWLPGSKSG